MSDTDKITMTDAIPPTAPRWDRDHQDLWTDLHAEFCNSLLADALVTDPENPHRHAPPTEDYLHERMRLAARLADTALKELDFRFYNHGPRLQPRRHPKRRAAPAPQARKRR